jgi:predicted nucleic acid-binding protein
MIKKQFVDTGVAVRYLTQAIKLPHEVVLYMCISMVTKIELYNWLSNFMTTNKQERANLLKVIRAIPVIHINTTISKEAERFGDDNRNSKPQDILIGFTVKHYEGILHTGDKDDFNEMGIEIVYYPQKKSRKNNAYNIKLKN